MKKIVSLLLTALMAFSAMTVGAVSASAAEDDNIAFKAGSRIYFDNTDAQWDEIYFYAWNYGYFGDFVPMEKEEAEVDEDGQPIKGDLYYVVTPVDVPATVEQGGVSVPTEYFLFTNSKTWSGQQTANMPVEVGMNTYKPVKTDGAFTYDAEGHITSVDLSFTNIAPQPEILAAPLSKDFTGSITVSVYAFNVPADKTATYQVNEEPAVAFTGSHSFTFTETTTLTVTLGDVSKTYTYTEKSDAVITATADNYTGDIYVYTFGGDRVGTSFNKMTYDAATGNYTYSINGSAQVIFTTSDNWNTARKFIIRDMDYNELPNQEPLVSAGEEVSYILTLS